MINWQRIEDFPKEKLGELVLVHYDHDKDPYVDPNNLSRLTDYGALDEGGDFCDGTGITVAMWIPGCWESVDEYGAGYWLPAGWFAEDRFRDYSVVCNPTHWATLEPPKNTRNRKQWNGLKWDMPILLSLLKFTKMGISVLSIVQSFQNR